MFCAKCGTQVEEGSKFCQKCGTPVVQAAAQPQMVSAPPVNFQPAAAIKNSGMAVASLVLGIVGMVFIPFIPSILAIIFGALGIGQVNKSNGLLKGKGMATAGIILGIIAVVWMIIMVAWVGFSWNWISEFSHEFSDFTY
jgi:hypothetical protein